MDASNNTDVRTLRHVNTPMAQTWNYLRVNDIALDVPEPRANGRVYEAVPRLFAGIDCGLGEEAVRWTTEAAGDARYIEVPRGVTREEPIVLRQCSGESSNVALMLRAGSAATVVVVAEGNEPGTTSSSLLRAYVERGARLTLLEFVTSSHEARHLEGVGIHAERDAQVEVRQYALGGDVAAFGFACDLAEERSGLELAMRYHASGSGTLDVNQLCRMRGRDSRAAMFSNGVVADAAHKTVRQTIDLVHGARGAKGDEADTTLVTGDDVVNKTLPTILCDEEDVAGNHGATIGSVSEEQLAYLATRGLSREEAEALFVLAIFDDALIHAPEWTSQSAVLARAEEVLGAETAQDAARILDIIGDEDEEDFA
jgi:Fe-S cluster assembly scaffold protein SufB